MLTWQGRKVNTGKKEKERKNRRKREEERKEKWAGPGKERKEKIKIKVKVNWALTIDPIPVQFSGLFTVQAQAHDCLNC
jgi:hypothetical protein